jgi:ABC-type phosphate transport system permease subunit
MQEVALIFLAQYFQILLLGIQSRNVQHSNIPGAVVASLMLGGLGLYMTTSIARSAVEGGTIAFYGAYLIAGPCGIASAIVLHDRFKKVKK